MNERFLRLEQDKQEKLLKAICVEFTEYSYEFVSTNRIVEKAGISKGTLFNYFESKEKMYHNLLEYALNYFAASTIEHFETNDFIERCKIMAEIDIKMHQENPHLVEFFATLYTNTPTHVPEKIMTDATKMVTETMEKLYKNIDMSLFKKDFLEIDVIRIVRFILDGYMQDFMARMKNTKITANSLQEWLDDYDVFLQQIKYIFYINND